MPVWCYPVGSWHCLNFDSPQVLYSPVPARECLVVRRGTSDLAPPPYSIQAAIFLATVTRVVTGLLLHYGKM